MKEIDGQKIYGIEDVRYSEEVWCEHCGDLEPFDATLEMGTNWCMDCARYNDDFQLSEDEKKAIRIQELVYKFRYFNKRLQSVATSLSNAFDDANEEVIALLHPVKAEE